ncbi:MAG: amidohydrolase family protein, partial [Myxococcota bacterium]
MPPRLIFSNANVLTVDPENHVADAVAVADDRIVAIGSLEEVRAALPDATPVDLDGNTLIPGFVDAHSHMIMSGELATLNVDLNSPPIGEVLSIGDVVERLSTRARATQPGGWVIGQGYDDTLMFENRHPTRDDLDLVSRDHPVVARHISGHFASVNSRALEIAEIGRDAKSPSGGVIRKDASGEPDGVLEESAMFAVLARVPKRSTEERFAAITYAAKQYARHGITTAQNGFTLGYELEDLDSAIGDGRVPIRVVAWP